MLVLTGVLAIGGSAVVASALFSRRERRRRFGGREYLEPEEIYSRYYRDTGLTKELVVRVWEECAETLSVESGKLRPSDRFDRELAGLDRLRLTQDDASRLLEDASLKARQARVAFESDTVATLDDLIRQLVEIESRQR
jgi:hypothetical protein